MPTRRFNSLRDRLTAEGIAPRYAQRLISELAQHWGDLVEAACAEGLSHGEAARHADQQIGTDEAIVEQIRASGRYYAFGRRHPVMCFVVAPVLALGALSAMCLAVLAGAFVALYAVSPPHLEAWHVAFARAVSLSSVPFIGAALTGWLFFYARNRSCPMYWAMAACAVLSIAAGLFFIDLIPPNGVERGTLVGAIRLPWPMWTMPIPMLAPAATFVLLWWVAPWPTAATAHPAQSSNGSST